MRYEEFLSLLKESGIVVFTVKDASKILDKSRQYTAKFINGREGIERIEKGKYCLSGTNEDIVASHIVYPSYLSLITAFRFYNLTTQLPTEKYIITTVQHKPTSFHNYKLYFVKVKKKALFGFETINGVCVATPEKAFIDALYLKKAVWYSEEFENGMAKGMINIDRLKRYADALGDSALKQRLRTFLEHTYSINNGGLVDRHKTRDIIKSKKKNKTIIKV